MYQKTKRHWWTWFFCIILEPYSLVSIEIQFCQFLDFFARPLNEAKLAAWWTLGQAHMHFNDATSSAVTLDLLRVTVHNFLVAELIWPNKPLKRAWIKTFSKTNLQNSLKKCVDLHKEHLSRYACIIGCQVFTIILC